MAPEKSKKQLFDDSVALVTGTSDRGIGGAIAHRLASEGARIFMLSDKEPSRLLKRLSKFGDKICWTLCDVRDANQVNRAVKTCIEEFGKIDCLINNAGVDTISAIEKTTEEQWQLLVDVNLSGVWRMSRACVPFLEESNGVIVNISSATGLGGAAEMGAYSATKAGVDGLTRSLAIELAPKKVRVVSIAPALVITPMAAQHIEKLTPESEKLLEECHPLGFGTPQDVAAAVAFLASSDASWISGITLPMGWMPSYPLPLTAQ